MKKKGLVIVIALLCVASLMAAMAYNSAVVTNAATIKIANTNTALLALNPLGGVGNLDKTAEVIGGDLVFQFGRGNNPYFGGDMNYGLQKNSVYEWWKGGVSNTGMFAIQNRSAETIQVKIEAANIPTGVKIEMRQSMGWAPGGWVDISGGYIMPIQLASGNTCDVGVRITVNGSAVISTYSNMTITVTATAQ